MNFQKSIDCLMDNGMLIVDYELPSMSNLSDVKEYKYIASDTIEEGKVVKTDPEKGGKVKPGSARTVVTIYISSGEGVYIIEEGFIGQNYLEVKGKIEAKCECNVVVEKEKVDEVLVDNENYIEESNRNVIENEKIEKRDTRRVSLLRFSVVRITAERTAEPR